MQNRVHFPYEKQHIYKRFVGGLAIVVCPNGCPQWADSFQEDLRSTPQGPRIQVAKAGS